MIADGDVVAGPAALDGLQHDAGHDVADERRGRQRNGGAEYDAVEAEQLPTQPAVEGQEKDQHQDDREDTAKLDQLPAEIEMGLALEVLDEAVVGETRDQRDNDDGGNRLQDDYYVVHCALDCLRRSNDHW